MIRFNYAIIVFLLLTTLGCGKNGGASVGQEENNKDSLQPLYIEKALMTKTILIKNKTSDRVILTQLKIYLDHAPKGSVVHISIYLFSDSQVRYALADAYDRGVEIHLLIDSGRVDASVEENVKSF